MVVGCTLKPRILDLKKIRQEKMKKRNYLEGLEEYLKIPHMKKKRNYLEGLEVSNKELKVLHLKKIPHMKRNYLEALEVSNKELKAETKRADLLCAEEEENINDAEWIEYEEEDETEDEEYESDFIDDSEVNAVGKVKNELAKLRRNHR